MKTRNVVVAGVIAGVVVACSGPARDMLGAGMQDAGDAMRDGGALLAGSGPDTVMLDEAGQLLEDAGQALSDAGSALLDVGDRDGSASAQEPTIIEAECDTESGRRVTPDGTGAWTESVEYFATANLSLRYPEDGVGVVALLCSWEHEDPPTANSIPCNDGSSCVDYGDYPRARPECVVAPGFEISGTDATVSCGYRTGSRDGYATGGRWRFVRFFVPAR